MRILMTTSAMALIAGLGAAPALAQDQQNQDKQLNVAACDTTWNAVDQNQDATISPEEARQASELEFQRLDADNDGSIDVEEFANCRQAEMAAISGEGSGQQRGGQAGEQASEPGMEAETTFRTGEAPDLSELERSAPPRDRLPSDSQSSAEADAGAGQRGEQASEAGTEAETTFRTGEAPRQSPADQQASDQQATRDDQSGAEGQADAGVNVPAPDADIPAPDIAQADGDGDRTVTRDEFLAGVREHYQQNQQAFEGISEEQHARAAAFWFDRFDRDDSGDIGREELASAERLVQGGFAEADRDRDRMLSEEEWSAVEESREADGSAPSGAAAPATGGQAEEKEGFAALDIDNDGKLSPSEWTAQDLRRRAERDFSAIDANQDGRISQEEWQTSAQARFQQAQAGGPEAGAGEGPTVYRYYLFVY